MKVHYLEIVTNDVQGKVELMQARRGLSFGEPVMELGGARTAMSDDGMLIGIRAPMHDAETPVARPYFLTKTLHEDIEYLQKIGAEIAVPPMKIENHGEIAVYFVDGIQYGLWQT